jgi:hypothetical protein
MVTSDPLADINKGLLSTMPQVGQATFTAFDEWTGYEDWPSQKHRPKNYQSDQAHIHQSNMGQAIHLGNVRYLS